MFWMSSSPTLQDSFLDSLILSSWHSLQSSNNADVSSPFPPASFEQGLSQLPYSHYTSHLSRMFLWQLKSLMHYASWNIRKIVQIPIYQNQETRNNRSISFRNFFLCFNVKGEYWYWLENFKWEQKYKITDISIHS